MPDRITISLPNGCTLLEEAKKGYVGGIGTSSIFREALQALIDRNKSGDYLIPLPNWKAFDKSLVDMSDDELKKTEIRLKQLMHFVNTRQKARKKVETIR